MDEPDPGHVAKVETGTFDGAPGLGVLGNEGSAIIPNRGHRNSPRKPIEPGRRVSLEKSSPLSRPSKKRKRVNPDAESTHPNPMTLSPVSHLIKKSRERMDEIIDEWSGKYSDVLSENTELKATMENMRKHQEDTAVLKADNERLRIEKEE